MGEPLLSIHDLRVQYGMLLAVDGVSFDLHAGDLLGLIGPNGAGKTTTLRAAAGLQPLTTGAIRVLEHDVFADPTFVGRHVGFTPDTPQLYETLTVQQFLEFIGHCYSLDREPLAERIDHWLEQLWLKDKRDAKISSLSRGMRQRLAVARTLLPDPHVILMDEPAAGLDPAGRVEFRRLLASLRDQGKALIVSSHILADLAEYCTHIGIIGHGRMLQFGTVDEVTGSGVQDRIRYHVRLATPIGDLASRLEDIALLATAERLESDGQIITLEYDRDPQAAARLLRELVAAGLPVAEFHPIRPDLEEAYLRTGIRQVD
jgi:ABC-2 type transport system ATP-binding protein